MSFYDIDKVKAGSVAPIKGIAKNGAVQTDNKQAGNIVGGATEPKQLSKEEIEKKLDGYIIVPERYWGDIGQGTHIRYFLKDGKFRIGSYVKYIDKDRKYLKLETIKGGSENSPYYKQFSVDLENVKEIYKKVDAPLAIELRMILEDQMQLRKRIETLEKIITKLVAE